MESWPSLIAATRKGLLELDPAAPRLFQRGHFLAEPVTAFCEDPATGAWLAALSLGHFGVKLHRSDDRGDTWRELTPPAFAKVEGDDGPSVRMIWTLEADGKGRLWAGTLPGALFRSEDGGETWSLVESLWNVPERADWFGGGYDHPGIHSILIDPRDRDRLTVGVSCGGVWRTEDAGASWRLGGEGLRAAYMPPGMVDARHIQDPHRLATNDRDPEVVWCQHHNGIFRSEDGGDTFHEIETVEPSFGFAVAVDPEDADIAWFVPAVRDEHRLPADQRLVVHRTRDGGQTFETIAEGLPDPSFDLIFRHALAVDSGGDRLVMGSTTGNLWTSADAGSTWTLRSGHLPTVYQLLWL